MPQASIALLAAATVLATVAAALLFLELRRGRVRTAELAGAIDRLSDELATAGKQRLVGRLVIVNTRKPDDQSIRGWVRAELDDGALELAEAYYLEPAGDGRVTPVLVGDTLIPASNVGWLQLDVTAPSTES